MCRQTFFLFWTHTHTYLQQMTLKQHFLKSKFTSDANYCKQPFLLVFLGQFYPGVLLFRLVRNNNKMF